jgi:hypothetical protein
MAFGPSGTGCINLDSFVSATPPTLPPALPKQINAGDKKYGVPKPKFLGGATGSNHAHGDTYYE